MRLLIKPVCAVVSTQPGVAFTTPDVEVDCVKLLATGLFRCIPVL